MAKAMEENKDLDIDKNMEPDLDLIEERDGKSREKGKKSKKSGGLKEWLKDIAIAVIVATVVLQFVKPTVVREYSMEPTLHPNDYLFLSKQAYRFGEPDRGDIVVFQSDFELENGKKKYLIKRIIGLPGETITIKNGKVYIDGAIIKEPYLKGMATDGNITNLEIPKDSIFAMGDNRENSLDSRDPSVGFVKMDRVLGKAFIKLYPFDEIKTL